MEKFQIDVIAFVGIGLIGGSLAFALRKSGVVNKIIAYDESQSAINDAVRLGIIDEGVEFETLASADLIVLSAPVDAFYSLCARLAELPLKEKVVITDVGSTKLSVLKAMTAAFGKVPSYFVPAHPIAGREKSGVVAAEADLFNGRTVIVTTLPNTDAFALGVVSRMWLATGALISQMSIDAHDEILGATSHLPHVLAYLLIDMLDQDLHHEEIFNYAAGGFRDFTRIASSSPVMWRDICVNNGDILKDLLAKYRERIMQFENLLEKKSGEEIKIIFERAKLARDSHYEKRNNL